MSPNFHRSWYDHNWDWALILLFALVLFAGIVLWTTYADRPQAAAIPDDATRTSQASVIIKSRPLSAEEDATTRCSRSGTTIIASRSHQKGGDCRADFASIPA